MIPPQPWTHNPNVPAACFELGRIVQAAKSDGKTAVDLAEEVANDDRSRFSWFRYFHFADEFVSNGAPTFVLSHSIAAALSATRAPQRAFSHCPYSAFLIEVPSEFLPLEGYGSGTKRWISVLMTEFIRAVAIHVKGATSVVHLQGIYPEGADVDVQWLFREGELKNVTPEAMPLAFEMRLALRLAANVITFVTAYRENVTLRSGSCSPSSVRWLDVGCPREVRVDRAFRDHVKALVASRTIPRARGVLAHLVRGHWRSRPVQKELIWIAPYQRGDANIGQVVERTERL
jgi:hypothetical protein